MSVFGLERSQTAPAAAYDHAIGLVDSTKPKDDPVDNGDATSDSLLVSRSDSGSQSNRQWTRPHLRKELARRKYAKWQEEEEEPPEGGEVPRTSLDTNGGNEEGSTSPVKVKPVKQGTWGTQKRLRDMVPFRSKKDHYGSTSKDTTFIDVLYENQRGSFLCGIPLYSAKSLLNFDPGGWQTAIFKDSPVDITNAQLPDPSWVWAWRTWYVDMSHDVDEEGWEYSFSFSPNFAWHGNHPWFHSFCRRRRWLRKRVKAHGRIDDKREGKGMKEAHRLTADYFTIHAAKRDRSRSTSGDRNTTRRSSMMPGHQIEDDGEDELTDIPNVAALMKAMRLARLDRERNGAVAKFLEQGGDELFYLAEAIPTIMEDFIHQTSRRQLQHKLLQALDDALTAESEPKDDDNNDDNKQGAHKRRVDNLLKAINVAGVHFNDQAYWSDLGARVAGQGKDSMDQTHTIDATETADVEPRDDIKDHIDGEGGVGDEIKGISKDAEISVEPGIRRPNTEREGDVEDKKLDKGKGREKA